MNSGTDGTAGPAGGWPPRFRAGLTVVLAFVLAFVAVTVATNALQGWLFGDDVSWITNTLSEIPVYLLLGAATVFALRAEGVEIRDLGVSWNHARTAAIAVAGVVLTVNLFVAAVALSGGTNLDVGIYAQYVRQLDATATLLAVGAVNSYLVVGPAEELVFRGYLQNKVLDLTDGRHSRVRTALGIVATAILFAVMHLPNVLLDEGTTLTNAIGGLLLLTVTAVLFGVIYELTQNLVLVAALHGIGNWWPLVVDAGPGSWPNYGALLVFYAALVWLYRRAERTDVRVDVAGTDG